MTNVPAYQVEPIADPNLSIEWFKDGRPVTVGHRFRPIHDFGYLFFTKKLAECGDDKLKN